MSTGPKSKALVPNAIFEDADGTRLFSWGFSQVGKDLFLDLAVRSSVTFGNSLENSPFTTEVDNPSFQSALQELQKLRQKGEPTERWLWLEEALISTVQYTISLYDELADIDKVLHEFPLSKEQKALILWWAVEDGDLKAKAAKEVRRRA